MSWVVRSLKMYPFYRPGESTSLINYNSGGIEGSCATVGTQPGCDICPSDTSTCISTCNQDEFGDDCDACHVFCSTCDGGDQPEHCLTCTTDESLNVIFSEVHGNCTCEDGYYWETSTDTCEVCNVRCERCYGPSYTDCMGCTAANHHPDTDNCVYSCSYYDDVPNEIYYFSNEDSMETDYDFCDKCHPACSACWGPDAQSCSACLNGYFLNANTNECFSTCP
jgi:proprotein convertase subtilisin/kexin type 5